MPLPDSALLGLWLTAVLRGSAGPDDLAEAVRGEAPRHLVVGWPDAPEPFDLTLLAGAARRTGVGAVQVALPVPGDPVGLAGPAAFNQRALGSEEALLVVTGTDAVGLVPVLDARTVLWQAEPVAAPPLLDPREAARTLRGTLVESTAELVRLDVASWQPEIPDLLLNLRHRAPLPVPAGTDPERVEALERASLCSEIVALALDDHGGAVTAHEMEQRRRCLTELDRAARRALVALCSDTLSPS